MANFDKKADIAFIASMLGVALQLLLLVLSTVVFVPAHKADAASWAVTFAISAPILLLLPWLVKRNIRAHIWLCFLMLGYFLPAVQQSFAYPHFGWLPFVEVVNNVYVFIIAMMFARWEQKRYQISVTR